MHETGQLAKAVVNSAHLKLIKLLPKDEEESIYK